MQDTLLTIPIPTESKEESLEKIVKYINTPTDFFTIVSLNPEILVETIKNTKFKEVVTRAQMKIIDGSGVIAAARLKGIEHSPRFTGVELMEELLKIAHSQRLRVLLIGGKAKVAERIVECQIQAGSEAIFTATDGIKDIHNPTEKEQEAILSIVRRFRPHIVLVAFGSPFSELWLYNHRAQLKHCLCASVGGAFDYLAGTVTRPPKIVRQLGLEYILRLLREPWRWRRQLTLLTFVRLSFIEALNRRMGRG